ncbi:unnamed protein product [Pylaiella littoralis]
MRAGWRRRGGMEGGGTGGFGDNDKGFSQFDDGGGEKGWKRKKRRRKRGWDQEVRYKTLLAGSIGNLEQELMGMWESDNRGGGDDNFIKPGEKRGGIEGRRARGGGDFRRRGASGDYGGGREGGRGPISRAVSDEDLFESLFGDQGLAGVDVGDGSAGLSDTYTDLLLGAPGEGDGERRKRGRGRGRKGSQGESEGFLLGDGDEDMEEEEEEEEAEVEQEPPPRPTRELYEEALAALTPELHAMWTELQEAVGTAAAVPILQQIVEATPDGAVQPELFQALFPFELDPFQTEALRGLAGRNNVIVSAPTGSGKTVVGELAVYYALALNLRVFYTTPLKALSNQKFQDFRRQFGEDKVGLLTGDSSFNRDAQVAVMTTEVFRNMLYDSEETGDLEDVFAVVFDEFHYMNDRDRGTVWEESVINCPKTVLMVALSATMSNVGEIKEWVEHTHGPSSLVVSDFRPVPLSYWFATTDGLYNLFRDPDSGPGAPNGGRRSGEGSGDDDPFVESNKEFGGKPVPRSVRRKRNRLPSRLRINDELLESHEDEMRAAKRDAERNNYDGRGSGGSKYGGGGGGGGSRGGSRDRRGSSDRGSYQGRRDDRGGDGGGRYGDSGNRRDARKNMRNAAYRAVPSFPYLVRCLGRKDLLPAIVFIFSRVGCDQAAKQVGQDSTALLNVVERRTVEQRLAAFQEANPQVPIPDSWKQLILLGISTHHAGLLPVFKSFVEELFAEALVKVVFATETLAAGVNMPARATVITTLSKRIDAGIVKLNPSQLLQMGGRAGRRGKDSSGSVVLMRSRFEDCIEAHRLLLSPMDGIQSQFKSSYGMAVGVLRTRDMESARVLVEKSFGNFLRRKRVGPAQSRASEAQKQLDALKDQLQGLSLAEAKFYRKLWERMESEKGILSYLQAQDREAEQEVVETILPLARLGSGITLRDGRTSALLGEMTPAAAAAAQLVKRHSDGGVSEGGAGGERCSSAGRYLVLDRSGKVEAVLPSQMRQIDCAHEAGISAALAVELADMVSPRGAWVCSPNDNDNGLAEVGAAAEPPPPSGGLVAVLEDRFPRDAADVQELRINSEAFSLIPSEDEAKGWDTSALANAGQCMLVDEEGATPSVPGHIQRQLSVMSRVANQMESHPVNHLEDPDFIARISKEIISLEEQVRQGWKTEQKLKQPAWEEFLAVCRVLRRYDALKDEEVQAKPGGEKESGDGLAADSDNDKEPIATEPKPTAFGRMIGSINAENELWMALVLTRQSILQLGYTELASLMPAILNEYTRPDLFTLYGPSEGVLAFLEELGPIASELSEVQMMDQVEQPVRLDGKLCGLVEGWANGCDWSELVASTSLDQGDLCRILRRAMEMLRQIPVLPGLPAVLKDRARLAADSLDRFPVSDDTSYLLRASTTEVGDQEEEEEEDDHEGEMLRQGVESAVAADDVIVVGGSVSSGERILEDFLDDDGIAAWEAGEDAAAAGA